MSERTADGGPAWVDQTGLADEQLALLGCGTSIGRSDCATRASGAQRHLDSIWKPARKSNTTSACAHTMLSCHELLPRSCTIASIRSWQTTRSHRLKPVKSSSQCVTAHEETACAPALRAKHRAARFKSRMGLNGSEVPLTV